MNFFLNKKKFKDRKVTQDMWGIYFENNKTGKLWGTTIDKFTQAQAPRGYTKKFNGSHSDTNYLGVNIKKQKAYDISGVSGEVITADFDVKIDGVYDKGIQKYVVVSFGRRVLGVPRWQFYFVHSKPLAKVGSTVKAGKPICELNWHHVHAYCKLYGVPFRIKRFILKG